MTHKTDAVVPMRTAAELLTYVGDLCDQLAASYTSTLDTCSTILETIEKRDAAREQAIHGAQSEAFRSRVNIYNAVAAVVREVGHQAVIKCRRKQARTDETTPAQLREFESLVRAIDAGTSLSEFVEFESPKAWFNRQRDGQQQDAGATTESE